MATTQRGLQRQLMNKYNIFFDGPIDSIANPQWPSTCNTIFDHIRQLGKTDYSQYRESISADFTRSPWRSQVQRRAKRITEKAKLCLGSRRNESGWRLSLESEVMARFSVEITCRNCRGRLWRSEQEVVAATQPGDDEVNSLKARQSRRQSCTCNANGLAGEIQEQGISPLFDDRAEEAIVYSPELQAELPTRQDRPDRVYGLRVTERLSRLLQSAGTVRNSPFKVDGDPLVFPFLVIEAKSEKGSDAFTDTQAQTAFAIRELLSIQHQLAEAAEKDGEWDSGPLVWFLSYKGEQWRASAAYIHTTKKKTFYRVVRLWSGSVDSLDNALQLLLIIDYIADWARDIYREGIARSLQKIALADTQSLAHDTDIFSLAGNVKNWDCGTREISVLGVGQPTEDPLQNFDCGYTSLRDSRFINTKFVGLIITESNIDEFLGTADSNNDLKKLIDSLFSCMQQPIRVQGHLLDELEFLWTETERNFSVLAHPDEIFYVVVTASFYLTTNWEQIRELNYLAVSESLVKDLVKIGDLQNHSQHIERAPLVNSLAGFKWLVQRTDRYNLAACLSRLCVVTGTWVINDYEHRKWVDLPTATDSSGSSSGSFVGSPMIKLSPRPHARDFVTSIYLKHQVGRNEPTSPIFRLSTAMDIVSRLEESHLSARPSMEPEWLWRQCAGSSFINSRDQSLLHVALDSDYPGFSAQTVCVFVLDTVAVERGIRPDSLLKLPEYHVIAKPYNPKNASRRGWNFKSSVKFGASEALIECLCFWRIHLETCRISVGCLPMKKWDILMLGWKVPSVTGDESQVTPARPFRRLPYQVSLKARLLGQSAEEMFGNMVLSPAADKGEWSADRGRKRSIGAVEEIDLTEETAHSSQQALHQQSWIRKYCTDFLPDEEVENMIRDGKFT
ncbi:hypothetical protein SNK05_010704 [Fusarium graminearum]|nr:hypothetical protein FG05_30330 [Fusarium graminearum]